MVAISNVIGVDGYVLNDTNFKAANYAHFVCAIANRNNMHVLFCGNAMIHKSFQQKKNIHEKGVMILFNLVREPDLNSIEKFFNVVKHKYRRKRLENLIFDEKKTEKMLLKKFFSSIDPKVPKNICDEGIKR